MNDGPMDRGAVDSAPRVPLSLVLLTLLAAAIRFGTLTRMSLWMDEYIWTLTADLDSLGAIFNRPDGHPPTIALLVRGLAALGLGSDFVLRAPAALAGTLSVPALYYFGRRLIGHPVAIAAAGLLAVHPFAVWYSQELGAYAMLSLFALTASLCLLRLLDGGGTGAAVGYVASVACGFGVHYGFAFVVLAHVPFAALSLGRARGPSRRTLAVTTLLTAAALLVWSPMVLDDVRAQRGHDRGSAASLFAVPYTAQIFAGGFGLGPPQREMHAVAGSTPGDLTARQMAPPIAGIALLAWLMLLGLTADWGGRLPLLVTLAILPILGPWMSSFAGAGYRPRDAIAALPFALLLAAGALDTPRRRSVLLLFVPLVLVELYGLVRSFHPDHAREDTRSAAIYVAAGGGGPVILLGEGAEAYRRYARAPGTLIDLDLGDVRDPATLGPLLDPILASGTDVWLVSSLPWTEDPDGAVPNRLSQSLRPAERKRFAGVVVQRYTR